MKKRKAKKYTPKKKSTPKPASFKKPPASENLYQIEDGEGIYIFRANTPEDAGIIYFEGFLSSVEYVSREAEPMSDNNKFKLSYITQDDSSCCHFDEIEIEDITDSYRPIN